jgi:RES domain-containing protein
MRVWRLTTRKYLAEVFSGKGAAAEGGRWNREGSAAVYTASSLALAALEYFVNLDQWAAPQLVAIPVDVPDDVRRVALAISDLPSNWRAVQPTATQSIGQRWLNARDSAVLSVPSVVIPQERNYVLNPGHEHFRRLRIGESEPFAFDPRMWK